MKSGGRKSHFSPREDKRLVQIVKKLGAENWAEVSKAFRDKTPKQCHYRWKNYMNPSLNRGEWTKEEDDFIVGKFQELGTKWAIISSMMPKRSPNDIRNRFIKIKGSINPPEEKSDESDRSQESQQSYSSMTSSNDSEDNTASSIIDEVLSKVQMDMQNIENTIFATTFEWI